MINQGMFTSRTCEWETPQALFDALDARYHFDTDVCARAENAKCKRFFSPEEDGLAQEWQGVCWMNPPYGREIGKWVRKAYETSLRGGVRSYAYCRRAQTRHGGMTTACAGR